MRTASVAVVICVLFCMPTLGQVKTLRAPASTAWLDRMWWIDDLAVMISHEPDSPCFAAGIIVGYKGDRVYVITADHVLPQPAPNLPALGIMFRMSHQREPTPLHPADERWFAGRVLHRDSDLNIDLAVVEVRSREVVTALAANPRLRVSLGRTASLRAGDPTYTVGCGEGKGWDSPLRLTEILDNPESGSAHLLFRNEYARNGFSGGPLVYVDGEVPVIVGMTLRVGLPDPNSRMWGTVARALRIEPALDRLRTWRVPLLLGVDAAGR
jgi:Trypsin-like peptidase domain